MHIDMQWQDGDYSSAKAFREHFPDEEKSRTMLYGEHVARTQFIHTKLIGECDKHKSLSTIMQDTHKKKIFQLSPQLNTTAKNSIIRTVK